MSHIGPNTYVARAAEPYAEALSALGIIWGHSDHGLIIMKEVDWKLALMARAVVLVPNEVDSLPLPLTEHSKH